MPNTFWVIERFENGKSQGYWAGDSSRDFIADIDKAIQFCRKEDAWRIKRGWHWNDTQTTEHSYLEREQAQKLLSSPGSSPIYPIKNEMDYQMALARAEVIFGAQEETPEGYELDALVTLIQAYEKRHYA